MSVDLGDPNRFESCLSNLTRSIFVTCGGGSIEPHYEWQYRGLCCDVCRSAIGGAVILSKCGSSITHFGCRHGVSDWGHVYPRWQFPIRMD